MLKKIVTFSLIFLLGFFLVYFLIKFSFTNSSAPAQLIKTSVESIGIKQHQVIGFLPFWLIDKADKDYSKYLTTLTYFGLTVTADGSIQKYVNPGEAEPGWYALTSGKYIPSSTLKNSLLIFSGNPDTINQLIADPVNNAATMMAEINPIIQQYNFTDLNLDLENVLPASPSAQQNFTTFVQTVRQNLNPSITLTLDASPTDLIKDRLINLKDVEPYVDYIVLMTYDYHYSGSYVTGPVAPTGGAGAYSEFDTETGIQKALEVIPSTKIILGIPLYGYEWETITSNPRAAVLPGSGIVASNRRIEEFISQCATCSAQTETDAQEAYLIYLDQATNTYHQFFYPEAKATQAKINLASQYHLGGLAFWALGYEGNTILNPVASYKSALK
ncbi:MAG: glycosyl hydrolase family 18 protein [Patescibacteria group bacterium]